jgi:outer membrane lipoprotein carrier protein
MIHIFKYLSIFTLVISEVCNAGGIDELRLFNQRVSGAQGEFSQSVIGRNGQAGKTSSGDFSFQRPGKFNWQIKKPFEQRIVSDGMKLFIYDTDLAQVSIRPLGDALASTPAALLFGTQGLDRLFDLKDEPSTDGYQWVTAVPKAKDSNFTRIRIGFQDHWPTQMEIADALGQTSRLSMKNWRSMETAQEDMFRFVPPPGVDVIDATQNSKRGVAPAQKP